MSLTMCPRGTAELTCNNPARKSGIFSRRQRLQNAGRMIKLIVRIGTIQVTLFAINLPIH